MVDVPVRLVFFPGERSDGQTIIGTIYVVDGSGRVIDTAKAAGGPSLLRQDRGGHSAEPTPAGTYVLGPKHRHVTQGWPSSVIPWGAKLRLNTKNEVEYEGTRGLWYLATGRNGAVTHAYTTFWQRGHVPATQEDAIQAARDLFVDSSNGKLKRDQWLNNDFGPWAWDLIKDGSTTPYYIHTTPDNEKSSSQYRTDVLSNSHGCIHLAPDDRDRLVKAGYLVEGVSFEVRPYKDVGPPAPQITVQ